MAALRPAVAVAAGFTLAGCAVVDSMTGTWHGADEGPLAHVDIVPPKHGAGALYFCAEDGWRTVEATQTEVPAGRPLKLKSYAAGDTHLHHGVEHPERACIENLQFRPQADATYRIVWNTQASSCALIVLHKPTGGSHPPGADAPPADEWPYEETLEHSDDVCGSAR